MVCMMIDISVFSYKFQLIWIERFQNYFERYSLRLKGIKSQFKFVLIGMEKFKTNNTKMKYALFEVN
jgi:hypothetical protein